MEEIRGVLGVFEGCFRGFCVSDGEIATCVETGGVGAVFRCVVEGFSVSFFLEFDISLFLKYRIWLLFCSFAINSKVMTKVIHVQLLKGRRNYYFGSIPAIYSVLTAEEIGIKQSSLERVGLSKGGVVLNGKAVIRAGELIRSTSKRSKS